MKWTVFVIVSLVAVAVETSKLTELVTLHAIGAVYPSLVGVVVVFVSLFAPRAAALWAAWSIGLLLDLAAPSGAGVLVGPHALGFTAGALLILQARTMVFRRRVLTFAVLALACVSISGLVEVTIVTVRSFFAEPGSAEAAIRPFVEALRRLGVALYTALLAIPVGWLLVKSIPIWSFEQVTERRRGGKSWR